VSRGWAALAHLVVVEVDGAERSVPIFDQLFVGRECAEISEPRRSSTFHPRLWIGVSFAQPSVHR
jgi:hypothetical protein